MILRRLEQAAPGQVVVVSAPAGYGKTLLLVEWARASEHPRTAWVSLHGDHNDPRLLWGDIANSLLDLPSIDSDLRLQTSVGLSTLPGNRVVEMLADTVAALDVPVRLVLDDVQELAGRDVQRELSRLVQLSPLNLQLVLASRSDPPVSIPRLRLEGRLHELRADA
ncbi:MAG TPA: AAA family ATPase, partial [Myxococcaceae bacterium]|nr:AAA family ATPase [Myxococcaceae bacterium]